MSDSGTGSTDDADSTGTFATVVIRAWMEPGQKDRFRARLTFGNESGKAGSTIVSSAPNDVLEAVRDWLASVQATESGSEAPPSPEKPQQ